MGGGGEEPRGAVADGRGVDRRVPGVPGRGRPRGVGRRRRWRRPRAVRALGVNLLVVEPAGKSIALLRQIGATFRRGGGPVGPGLGGSERGRAS